MIAAGGHLEGDGGLKGDRDRKARWANSSCPLASSTDHEGAFHNAVQRVTKRVWAAHGLEGCVACIHKKGDREGLRTQGFVSPISMVPKALKRILTQHIVKYLASTDLISLIKHEFLARKRCTTNLICLLNEKPEGFDTADRVGISYLNSWKAFCPVNYSWPKDKLQNCGLL